MYIDFLPSKKPLVSSDFRTLKKSALQKPNPFVMPNLTAVFIYGTTAVSRDRCPALFAGAFEDVLTFRH